ncbi:hypothetical protein ACFQ3P_40250 [Paraburkholderia sabiae]|uniref:Uncharacterized protein n=1 Tax=Paraburkholderia sabiae TaxID=273251 RepID=A0ABU9QR00_9BURK|nr:hypothetical protein [Paraburkholderia sabiae]WJZ79382.1 hypothetical protein QEN71_41910 [Paraburkholderia sabiae]
MSKNPSFHVFNDEELRQHDLEVAARIDQITVARIVSEMNHMNAAQILRTKRGDGKELLMSREQLHAALDQIDNARKK